MPRWADLPEVLPDAIAPDSTEKCSAPIRWHAPFAEQPIPLFCGLYAGHTNDHVAMFGSLDHEPPVTVEVRW